MACASSRWDGDCLSVRLAASLSVLVHAVLSPSLSPSRCAAWAGGHVRSRV